MVKVLCLNVILVLTLRIQLSSGFKTATQNKIKNDQKTKPIFNSIFPLGIVQSSNYEAANEQFLEISTKPLNFFQNDQTSDYETEISSGLSSTTNPDLNNQISLSVTGNNVSAEEMPVSPGGSGESGESGGSDASFVHQEIVLTCKSNEVYSSCGPVCKQNCENYKKKCFSRQSCKSGCFCKEDYVLNRYGTCVAAKHFCCPKYEFYNKCGSACQTTCKDLGKTCKNERNDCTNGCFCMEGFARNSKGRCIPIRECPTPKCEKENEGFNICSRGCERNCTNTNPVLCSSKCIPKCECSDAFYRDIYGNCITRADCLKLDLELQCTESQYYTPCGPQSEPICYDVIPPTNISVRTRRSLPIDACKAGCFCLPGLLRKISDGSCIPPSECDSLKVCPRNEEYQSCGTACPVTCANPIPNKNCIDLCVSGCFCKENYLRNKDKKCVEISKCS